MKRMITIVEKHCGFCGHDRAFDKKAGYFCSKCKIENKGYVTIKNKHNKEVSVPKR